MSAKNVTVVIVAWNQVQKTLDCLATVAALSTPPGRVLLVDNGSEPPLAPAVAARFPAVELLRLPDNRGFAGGYNAGIRAALEGGAAAVLLLNNDTLVAPDALDRLAEALAADERIGLVTAKITYAADPQRIWTCLLYTSGRS